MDALPAIVTHIYHPARGPFRNLCEAGPASAEDILSGIAAEGRRRVKPNYLERRFETETWLRRRRTAKLGPPALRCPIYFFLGDFADGADPSRPASIRVPLSWFAPETVTFTYPDSMASLPLGHHPDHAAERQPYHGEVFTLTELEAVVATYGLPGQRWRSDQTRRFDRFIEMQLWDDASLRDVLYRTAG